MARGLIGHGSRVEVGRGSPSGAVISGGRDRGDVVGAVMRGWRLGAVLNREVLLRDLLERVRVLFVERRSIDEPVQSVLEA